MSDIKSFLDWFEGFAENIETVPTAKQWGRVLDRINNLNSAKPASGVPEAARRAEAEAKALAPVKVVKPKTETEWCVAYRQALKDLGLDEESAAEFTEDARSAGINIASDPVAVAKSNVGQFLQ